MLEIFLHVLEKNFLGVHTLRRQGLCLPLASCVCGVVPPTFVHFVFPGGEWWLIYM